MEYEEELFEDDPNAITSQGLYDEQDVQARKAAVRKHLARSRLLQPMFNKLCWMYVENHMIGMAIIAVPPHLLVQ